MTQTYKSKSLRQHIKDEKQRKADNKHMNENDRKKQKDKDKKKKDKKKKQPNQGWRTQGYLNLSDATTLEDAIRHTWRFIHRRGGRVDSKQLCACWSRISHLVDVPPNWKGEDPQQRHHYKQQFKFVYKRTVDAINTKKFKDPIQLVGTILGISKVVKHIPIQGNEWRLELFEQLLCDYKDIFMSLAIESRSCLQKCNIQSLTNLASAYAQIEFLPLFDDDMSTLFDHIAYHAVKKLQSCKDVRNFSTFVWSFAKVGASSPHLFGAVTNIFMKRNLAVNLGPREISMMLWAYATAEEPSVLFVRLVDIIVGRDMNKFTPLDLKNIAWAYAKSGVSAPAIFKKVGDEVIERNNNIPESFTSQDLSNMAWAFAIAKEYDPDVFYSISMASMKMRDDFKAQEISILLWSFATVYIIDENLFMTFVPAAISLIEEFGIQNLSNIAWAFSVSNLAAPDLFNQRFIDAVLKKETFHCSSTLSQLHQWQLWQHELNTNICFPPEFQSNCYRAFVSNLIQTSDFQIEVMHELQAIGLYPQEEVQLPSGYFIDLLVQINGRGIGIEVDGPYHFIGTRPLGKTILKRRQVNNIDGIQVVSVPFFEWHKFGTISAMKQDYLHSVLNAEESVCCIDDEKTGLESIYKRLGF